jgi:hypothetical protein
MDAYKAPHLSGFSFQDPRLQDRRVGQYLKVADGLMLLRPPTLGAVAQQLDDHGRSVALIAPTMQPNETFAAERQLPSEEEPVTYGPVPRFYAYFREAVAESNEERSVSPTSASTCVARTTRL